MHQLYNAIFVVEERSENVDAPLLGRYHGTALTERFDYGAGEFSDRIVLNLIGYLDASDTLRELRQQVHITLVHEIAHYFGIDDDQLDELGWG